PPPGPLTDLAVTSVSGPSAGVPGTTAGITVTVKNVGNQNVSSFDVTLQDTTEHVTVGTQSVAGLAAGATTTLSFAWTPTVTGDHDLLARQTLADDKAVNDQRFVTIPVKLPVTDVALTAITAPARVTQGDTVPVVVTVQNVGGQDVTTSFDVVLTDATAGVTLGTQTVTGLAVGATATRTFNWTTATAALGGHTLVATHSLTDVNAANNQRSAVVTVNPPSTDVAVTGVNAPAAVTQGNTAAIGVTVQRSEERRVGRRFNIVLTDATAGVTLGTQTIAGLAVGASATRTFNWNTAGVATNGHILIAAQKLADNNSTNNCGAIAITVNPPPSTDVAVTGVTAPATVTQGTTAAIGVTVQNVGGLNVSTTFDVVLTDAPAGEAIGTQTVTGLAVGATATRTFSWNATSAALGGHTLVATHTLTDANAANNQRSAAVTVIAPTTDVAVSGMTAPSSVTYGSTAAIGVTVQNVGGLNVSTTFSVVLTDATAGVTIGTQTVTGLAAGATATRTFNWSTTGAARGGHT